MVFDFFIVFVLTNLIFNKTIFLEQCSRRALCNSYKHFIAKILRESLLQYVLNADNMTKAMRSLI